MKIDEWEKKYGIKTSAETKAGRGSNASASQSSGIDEWEKKYGVGAYAEQAKEPQPAQQTSPESTGGFDFKYAGQVDPTEPIEFKYTRPSGVAPIFDPEAYYRGSKDKKAALRSIIEAAPYSSYNVDDLPFMQEARAKALSDTTKWTGARKALQTGRGKTERRTGGRKQLPDGRQTAEQNKNKPREFVYRGNIDLNNRPVYRYPDGAIATVESLGVNIDGKEVLLPTIDFDKNGNPIKLSDDEAIERYYRTGEHLGKFDTVEEANEYAQQLHEQQKRLYANKADRPVDAIDRMMQTAARTNNPRVTGKTTLAPTENPMQYWHAPTSTFEYTNKPAFDYATRLAKQEETDRNNPLRALLPQDFNDTLEYDYTGELEQHLIRTGAATMENAPQMAKAIMAEAREKLHAPKQNKRSWLDHLGTAGANFVNQAGKFAGSTLNLAEQATVGNIVKFAWKLAGASEEKAQAAKESLPIHMLYEDINRNIGTLNEQAEADISGMSNDTEKTIARELYNLSGQLGSSAMFALTSVMSWATGGAQAVAEGVAGATTKGLEAFSYLQSHPSLARTLSNALWSMVQRQDWMQSFTLTFGSDFEEAKADGASDLNAVIYAIGNGILNATVEVGGDTGEGGLQSIPEKASRWKALNATWLEKAKDYLKSILQEGKEEVVQGIIQRLMQNLVYNKGNPILPNTGDVEKDADAVFNPSTAWEEFKGGAVGAVFLGGVQTKIVQLAQLGKYAKVGSELTNAFPEDMRDSVTEMLVADALSAPEGSAAHEYGVKVSEKIEAGEKIGNAMLGRLYVEVENAAKTFGTDTDTVPTEPSSQQQTVSVPVMQAIDQVMDGERVTNRVADEILQDEEAVAYLQSETGLEIASGMTNSQKREAVRTAVNSLVGTMDITAQENGTQPTQETPAAQENRTPAQQVANIGQTLNLGTNGMTALIEQYDGESDPMEYARAMTVVYNAGAAVTRGDGYNVAAAQDAFNQLTEEQQTAAYKAGIADEEARQKTKQNDDNIGFGDGDRFSFATRAIHRALNNYERASKREYNKMLDSIASDEESLAYLRKQAPEQMRAYDNAANIQNRKDRIRAQRDAIDDALMYLDAHGEHGYDEYYKTNETEGTTYGQGDTGYREGRVWGERNDAAQQGEEVAGGAATVGGVNDQGGVAEATGGGRKGDAWSPRRGKTPEARNLVYGREVTDSELGVKTDPSAPKVRAVTSGETPAMKRANATMKRVGELIGAKVRNLFFGGSNLSIVEDDGSVSRNVEAFSQAWRNFVALPADHPSITVDRFAGHEGMEELLSHGVVKLNEVVDAVRDIIGDDVFDEAVGVYRSIYHSDDTAHWTKEFICDGAGNINRQTAYVDVNDSPLLQARAQLLDVVLETIHNHLNEITDGAFSDVPPLESQMMDETDVPFVTEETQQTLEDVGAQIDTENEAVTPTDGATQYSERTWNLSDYVQKRNEAAEKIAEILGVSVKTAKKYINDINSVAKMIADDRVRLDYVAAEGESAVVGNVEYGGSGEFSTLCPKRRLFTGTYEAIQAAVPNGVITADDAVAIRALMADLGHEVPCTMCYVEGSRMKMGEYGEKFLALFKKYHPDAKWTPTMYDITTPDGAEDMRLNHADVYAEYEYFWNHHGKLRDGDPNLFSTQNKPKLYQSATAYDGELLKLFRDAATVDKKNKSGGFRMQSFSDFEIIHMIDFMHMVMDMSRVGLAGQAYTKVPAFAWAAGMTNIKVNLSLVAKGVDENGHLILDEVNGMKRADAEELRNAFSKNVGTIVCVFTDEQLKAAMADPFIDFIIPFHRSQLRKKDYQALGLPSGVKDYTYQQNEKLIKKTYHEYRGRMVEDKAKNFAPNEYWDFTKTGKENAEEYIRLCAKNNKRPKFYKLLVNNGDGSYSLQPDGSTDGYWKLLIDFKMYDNNGTGSPQMPVVPKFDMNRVTQLLNDYTGGHEKFPVAQDVVDAFLKDYKSRHKKTQYSTSPVSDEDYLAAVDRGDMETAQKMVDKAAKAAGYDPHLYHGSKKNGGFTVFKDWQYFTEKREYAERYAERGNDKSLYDVYVKADRLFDTRKPADRAVFEKYRKEYGMTELQQSGLPDWTDGYDLSEIIEENGLDYDGIILDEGGDLVDGKPVSRGVSYVIRKSNQVKSAEPVTYDDNGKPIPLSERFNPDETDIRRSVAPPPATERTVDSVLARKLEQARKRAAYWKGQTKTTTKALTKVAQDAVSTYNSTVKATDLLTRLQSLARNIFRAGDAAVDYEAIQTEARDIARDIINGAEILQGGNEDYFDDIRGRLKETRITISRADAETIEDYSNFRRHLPRYFQITTEAKPRKTRAGFFGLETRKDGVTTNVGELYDGLRTDYPWLFPDVDGAGAQLQKIAEVMQSLEPIYVNPYSETMADAIQWCANGIIDAITDEGIVPTLADKQEARISAERQAGKEALAALRKASNERLRDALKEKQEDTQKRLAELRADRDKKLADLKQHHRDVAEDKRQRKMISEIGSSLLKIMRQLNSMHMSTENRTALQAIIGDYDLTSKTLTDAMRTKLQGLQDYLVEKKKDPNYIPSSYVENAVDRLYKQHIGDLKPADQLALLNVLKNFKHNIETQNQFISSSIRMELDAAASATIQNIRNSKGNKKTIIRDVWLMNQLSPESAMHLFTGYVDDDPLYIATKDMSKGGLRQIDYQRRAYAIFDRFLKDDAFMDSISGSKAKFIKTKARKVDGSEVEISLTPAMRISLYLASMNKKNLLHIRDGGVRIPDPDLYRKGELQEAMKHGVRVKLEPSTVRRIALGDPSNGIPYLSDKEKSFARAAWRYFNEFSSPEVSKASEDMDGFAHPMEDNYFPIDSDGDFLLTDFASIKKDGTLSGVGWMKERVEGANSPIYLYDADFVVKKAIDAHSKYVGMLIPVRNFNKLWNASMGFYDENGKYEPHVLSVREAMGDKWGTSGEDYVERMLKSVQFGGEKKTSIEAIMRKALSAYAGAVLTFTPGTAVMQMTSFPTAAYIVGWEPLAKAFRQKNLNDTDLKMIQAYTPILWYRTRGYIDPEFGSLTESGKAKKGFANMIQGADILTTKRLWIASEYYVRDHFKGLGVGSPEQIAKGESPFYKKVAEVYEDVIRKTQPNYTPMERPQILKSNSVLERALVMFATQRFQNFNILYDSLGKMRAEKTRWINTGEESAKQAYKDAAKAASRAIWSQLAASFAFALVTAARDFLRGRTKKYRWRDKDLKDTWWWSVPAGLARNMLENGFGMFIFGSEIITKIESIVDAIAKGISGNTIFDAKEYGITISVLETINDISDDINKLAEKTSAAAANAIRGKDVNVEDLLRTTVGTAEDVGKITGKSVSNVKRLLEVVGNIVLKYAVPLLNPERAHLSKYYALRATVDPDKSKGEYYELLYKAYESNAEDYRSLYDIMLKDGFAEKGIKNAMEKKMKQEQGVKSVKDLPKRYEAP